MYSQPYYEVGDFWFGLAIGLAIAGAAFSLLYLRAWALRRIQFNLAKRVSTNFVVAGEIFRLLRLPAGSEGQLTPDLLTRLTANIEEHANFFANLLQDKQNFCLFFGNVFAWGFDDIGQIYSDFVESCAQLERRLSRSEAEEEAPSRAEMDKYLRVVVSGPDIMSDLTYFRLSRAVAVIDSVCRPILEAGRRRTEATEMKLGPLATALTRPV